MPSSIAESSNDAIVRFYRGEGPDDSGRMLAEILAWDDGRLEYTHNYIQWLFPMRTASPVNPDAATVTEQTIRAFHSDKALRERMAQAFERMAQFYGFAVKVRGRKVVLARSDHWAHRTANWLTPRNHNMLRITRILTSLRLLGLSDEAEAFFRALTALALSGEGKVIGEVTFGFWQEAMDTSI